MKTAGIRELKNQLSRYLRLVAGGEVVLVTERGTVVAQLAPPPILPGQGASDLQQLERLARQGKVRLASGSPPSASPQVVFPAPRRPIDLQEELDALRSDRL